MGRGKKSNIKGIWKNFILLFMDDFERFKTSVEEGTAGVGEIVRELELEVEPENVGELLYLYETWMEESLLTDEQRRWVVEMESTLEKGAVKIVKMTTEGLD